MRILFALGSLCVLVFCANKNVVHHVQATNIRVINRTEECFTNVMLFSMRFQDLMPRDTSDYQVLDFDLLRDDPLIYCSIGNVNYARYLEIPENGRTNFSYIIDSIQDRILYVSTVHEK